MSRALRVFFILVFFLCALGRQATATPDRTFLRAQSHLPKTIYPESYDIRLTPNIVEHSLQGRETIHLRFTQPSATVALYALGIRFSEVRIDGVRPPSMEIFDSGRGLWRFHFARRFAAGAHSLTIAYAAKMTDLFEQSGMFVAHSRDGASVATQMEATEARRVFPGWDEPVYKSHFHSQVVVPNTFTAISNMPVAGTHRVSQFEKLVDFQTTPPMSTYLVAICAGRYASQSIMVGKTKVTIYASPSKLWADNIALRSAAEVIPYFERYFGITYMLPKLDVVAVPNFNTAMENWGAIVGGENYLLLDPKRATGNQEKRIFETVAHEIAHQWVGDLVTHDAWNDLWLSEGFAAWMQRKAELALHPAWANDPSHAFDRTFTLLRDKGDEAIRETGSKRWTVSFSETQYEKAANMISLVEHVMRPAAFRLALHGYLVAHAYRSASTSDFFQAMNAASARSLGFISQPWLYQRGYAQLKIDGVCRDNLAHITIRQNEHKWWPVLLADRTLVDRPTFTFERRCDTPFAIADSASYFGVTYDDGAFALVDSHFSELPPALRDVVVEDGWAAPDGPAARYLPLLEKLNSRDGMLTIRDAFGMIFHIEGTAQHTSQAEQTQAYVRRHFAPAGDALLNSESNEPQVKDTRATLLYVLSLANDPVAIAYARNLVDSGAPFDPRAVSKLNFVDPLSYAIGVHAGRAEHAAFLDKARAQPNPYKAAFWYAAYFSDADSTLIPDELIALDTVPGELRYQRSEYLLRLAIVDSKRAWNYASTHALGENPFRINLRGLIGDFAMDVDDRSLESGASNWYPQAELSDIPKFAAAARMAQGRERSSVESFFATHS